jgi:hypothetical protein
MACLLWIRNRVFWFMGDNKNAYSTVLILVSYAVLGSWSEMNKNESWENKCCRCEGDTNLNLTPGKRACHLSCGPCLYPEDWGKCASCEIVGHCAYALDHLKGLKYIERGCFFSQQLTGEESLYHTMNFINGQQQLLRASGETAYLDSLKRANRKSDCLRK